MKIRHKKINALIAALLAAVLFLCACDGVENAPVVELEAQATQTQAAEGTGIDTLYIGVTEDLGSVNPFTPQSEQIASLNALIFESLVELDDDGSPDYGLAQDWSVAVNDDGTATWTFTIRQGVVFHDGTALTASDAAFSLLTAAAGSYYAQQLTGLLSAAAQDDATLVVTTASLDVTFPERLTVPIVPQAVYAAGGEIAQVGTGPYRLDVCDDADCFMKLVANASWWRAAATVQNVYVRKYHDASALFEGYQNGEIDVAYCAENFTGRDIAGASGTVYAVRTDTLDILVPNLSNELLSNVLVRQAIAYAIDEGAVISVVYANRAFDADLPVWPGHYLSGASAALYDYSPYLSKQLLAQAGYIDNDGDGYVDRLVDGAYVDYELTLLTNVTQTADTRREAAVLIAKQLGAIGLKVNVATTDIGSVTAAVAAGAYDLALTGLAVPAVPGVGYLCAAGSAGNRNGFGDAAVEEALAAMRAAQTKDDYTALAGDAETLILNACGTIALYYRAYALVADADLSGVDPFDALDAFHNLARWTRQ